MTNEKRNALERFGSAIATLLYGVSYKAYDTETEENSATIMCRPEWLGDKSKHLQVEIRVMEVGDA